MIAPSPLAASALVALGGAVGSLARYQVGRGMTRLLGPQHVATFPWATLVVNVAGSLAMGLLAGWLARGGQVGETWRLLVGVGLLGGFTTFSAFGLESWGMIERGAYPIAAFYVIASVVGAVLFTGLGLWITQR